jgi:glycosyltransferase involved in cell wall biosynthesis
VALVHHPLADETGLSAADRERLAASERRALTAARHVIVTSQATAAGLSRYGVAAGSITVVEPGTDAAPQARGSGGPDVELLCVASLVPRKGHDVLLRALAPLADEAWHLTCVGGLDHDPGWTATIRAQVHTLGLDDRVSLIGALGRSELDRRYDRADVFVLPTWYEGYGMAVAEALARGLPVVSTATGAIGDLVGDAAGRLVPAGDAAALSAALAPLLRDAALRARLGAGAREAWGRMPSWIDAAVRTERVLEGADG